MSDKDEFTIIETRRNRTVNLNLSGALTERAHFQLPDLQDIDTLVVDQEFISYINSVGIQKWVTWIRDIKRASPNLKMQFDKMSVLMAIKAGMVREFLPKAVQVTSVFIPYYCANCDLNHSVLIQEAEFKSGLFDAKAGPAAVCVKCTRCTRPSERDFDASKYFWFWK